MKLHLIPIALAAFALVSCARNHANHREMAYVSTPALETGSLSAGMSAGRMLFLKNCAHCHGADAHGDEGPDLHGLDWTDEQIATRIRNGKKGQMTAFAGKLSPDEIEQTIAYLRTLK
jgi:mono/diheme cytochrome c family protein